LTGTSTIPIYVSGGLVSVPGGIIVANLSSPASIVVLESTSEPPLKIDDTARSTDGQKLVLRAGSDTQTIVVASGNGTIADQTTKPSSKDRGKTTINGIQVLVSSTQQTGWFGKVKLPLVQASLGSAMSSGMRVADSGLPGQSDDGDPGDPDASAGIGLLDSAS